MVHGARDADVAKSALFFDLIRIKQRARVREQSLFHSGKHDQRELEPLGCMQRHKRDRSVGIVVVGVGDESGVVEEVGDVLATIMRVAGRIGELLQVLDARLRFGRVLFFEHADVAAAVHEELEHLGKRGSVTGCAEAFDGFGRCGCCSKGGRRFASLLGLPLSCEQGLALAQSRTRCRPLRRWRSQQVLLRRVQ